MENNLKNIKTYDSIDNTEIKLDEIFKIDGDNRYFKKCGKLGRGNKVAEYIVYGYLKKYEDGRNEIKFRMDYEQATKLARKFEIKIEYSKIIHIIKDHIFLGEHGRNQAKNWYGAWYREGQRYIAEAKATFPGELFNEDWNTREEMTRTGTAGIDNVGFAFLSYCPNMACKRASIKLVIDILCLSDISEDFYDPTEQEEDTKQNKSSDKKEDKEEIGPATKTQFNMIKQLLKKRGKKFLKKYEKFSKKEASDLIVELKVEA